MFAFIDILCYNIYIILSHGGFKMIYFTNQDCRLTMNRLINRNIKVDVILTSPPYNVQHNWHDDRKYDVYNDSLSVDEYIEWMIGIFNQFDKILKKNGVILFNFSYGISQTELMWLLIHDIITKTNFTVADKISWIKRNALPNNVSSNRLTRIVEDIFVIVRNDELNTFHMNKPIVSTRENGQKMYKNIINVIEAMNNDGPCELNRSTFSSELCCKLLRLYAKDNSLIYDPFMGTGTTAVACRKLNLRCIGSEISKKQVDYSKQRLSKFNNRLF